MPDGGRHSLYDLQQLQPLVDSGQLLLTPNYRLVRRIKSEWDQRQAELGQVQWRPLRVLALETWLDQCVQQALAAGAIRPILVLDPMRALELWRQVIEEDSRDNYSLLQPAAAAQLAAQGRDNLLRWCVDIGADAVRAEFRLDEDCATFLRWLQSYEQRLAEGDFATRADSYQQLLQSDFQAPLATHPR